MCPPCNAKTKKKAVESNTYRDIMLIAFKDDRVDGDRFFANFIQPMKAFTHVGPDCQLTRIANGYFKNKHILSDVKFIFISIHCFQHRNKTC